MDYQLTSFDTIFYVPGKVYLPSQDNGTREWRAYKEWLAEGNTPEPAPVPPAPPALTPEERLAAAGLTVEELKTILGLT